MERFGSLWQLQALERAIARMQPSLDMMKAVSPPLLEQFRRIESISARFSFPADFLTVSDKIIRAMDVYNLNSSFPDLAAIDHTLLREMESIQKQMASIPNNTASVSASLDLVARSVADSLVGAEALLRLTENKLQNISVLTRAQESFGLFAVNRVDLALNESDVFINNSIGVLKASARLLPDMSHVSELGVFLDPVLANSLVELPSVNIFQEIDFGLEKFDMEDPNANVTSFIDKSPSTSVVEVGGRIVELVYKLNVEGERSGSQMSSW